MTTTSKGDCANHDEHRKLNRYGTPIAAFIAVIGLVILVIFLVLRPTKPQFTLQDISLFTFNVSSATTTSATTLTSNLQVTISSRNPNLRIGIHYDKLDVYASYRNQPITSKTMVPASYQGHKEVTVWSPFLYGNYAPLAPDLAVSLGQDEIAGLLQINIKANAEVRWSVGTFVTGRYHVHVNCPARIMCGNTDGGCSIGPAVKYQIVDGCHVEVG